MRPIPAQNSAAIKASENSIPSAIVPPVADYSHANRRASTCGVQRAYPCLLLASTAVAALFCFLYITKPVINGPQAGVATENPLATEPAPAAVPAPVEAGLMPSQKLLPGEKPRGVGESVPQAPALAQFEQTNLRIQHILTADAPNGHRAKINIDVPVLYQSRNLRWTAAEVADARVLLARLADYQENSRALRAEGSELLDSWNQLVGRSIPASELRADSPSLPENQQGSVPAPRPAGLDTTELIQIQPAGK